MVGGLSVSAGSLYGKTCVLIFTSRLHTAVWKKSSFERTKPHKQEAELRGVQRSSSRSSSGRGGGVDKKLASTRCFRSQGAAAAQHRSERGITFCASASSGSAHECLFHAGFASRPFVRACSEFRDLDRLFLMTCGALWKGEILLESKRSATSTYGALQMCVLQWTTLL